jgi:hypothetical protein
MELQLNYKLFCCDSLFSFGMIVLSMIEDNIILASLTGSLGQQSVF